MSDRDDKPRTHDPLGRIHAGLVAAVRQRQASRRRRRRVLAVCAAAAGLLATTGGAIAVTGTTTGVPAIDRWFDFLEERRPPPPATHGSAPQGDVRPAGGTVSSPFEVELGGGARAVAVAYESRGGMMCIGLADPGDVEGPPSGGTGCLSKRLLKGELRAVPGRRVGGSGLNTSTGRPAILVKGFARQDVRRIVATTTTGKPLASGLSRPWAPSGWDGEPIRAWVAVITGYLTDPHDGPPLRQIEVEVQLADGRRVPVRP